MGETLEKVLNKDKPVIWREEPHRPVRDGLIWIWEYTDFIFIPGSFYRAYKKRDDAEKNKLFFAGIILAEGIRFGAELYVAYYFNWFGLKDKIDPYFQKPNFVFNT